MARRRPARERPPLPRIPFFDKPPDRQRSCTSKDAYPTREHARAVAAMNGMADVLFAYECQYCAAWHLTRRREPS